MTSQNLTRRHVIALSAAGLLLPQTALAAAQKYQLIAARSQVGFSVTLGNDTLRGTMPVASADLTLDFNRVANSAVNVRLNAASAQMGVFFATDAIRSADFLDVARHPKIAFASTSVRAGATGSQAVVQGRVTVRGVTQAMTLNADLTQDADTVGQSNPELTLRLRGAVARADFGMTAYNGLVGPTVTLDIIARIKRA